jgi:hypothetical protein
MKGIGTLSSRQFVDHPDQNYYSTLFVFVELFADHNQLED